MVCPRTFNVWVLLGELFTQFVFSIDSEQDSSCSSSIISLHESRGNYKDVDIIKLSKLAADATYTIPFGFGNSYEFQAACGLLCAMGYTYKSDQSRQHAVELEKENMTFVCELSLLEFDDSGGKLRCLFYSGDTLGHLRRAPNASVTDRVLLGYRSCKPPCVYDYKQVGYISEDDRMGAQNLFPYKVTFPWLIGTNISELMSEDPTLDATYIKECLLACSKFVTLDGRYCTHVRVAINRTPEYSSSCTLTTDINWDIQSQSNDPTRGSGKVFADDRVYKKMNCRSEELADNLSGAEEETTMIKEPEKIPRLIITPSQILSSHVGMGIRVKCHLENQFKVSARQKYQMTWMQRINSSFKVVSFGKAEGPSTRRIEQYCLGPNCDHMVLEIQNVSQPDTSAFSCLIQGIPILIKSLVIRLDFPAANAMINPLMPFISHGSNITFTCSCGYVTGGHTTAMWYDLRRRQLLKEGPALDSPLVSIFNDGSNRSRLTCYHVTADEFNNSYDCRCVYNYPDYFTWSHARLRFNATGPRSTTQEQLYVKMLNKGEIRLEIHPEDFILTSPGLRTKANCSLTMNQSLLKDFNSITWVPTNIVDYYTISLRKQSTGKHNQPRTLISIIAILDIIKVRTQTFNDYRCIAEFKHGVQISKTLHVDARAPFDLVTSIGHPEHTLIRGMDAQFWCEVGPFFGSPSITWVESRTGKPTTDDNASRAYQERSRKNAAAYLFIRNLTVQDGNSFTCKCRIDELPYSWLEDHLRFRVKRDTGNRNLSLVSATMRKNRGPCNFCKNGGECVEVSGAVYCLCPAYYTGDSCQINSISSVIKLVTLVLGVASIATLCLLSVRCRNANGPDASESTSAKSPKLEISEDELDSITSLTPSALRLHLEIHGFPNSTSRFTKGYPIKAKDRGSPEVSEIINQEIADILETTEAYQEPSTVINEEQSSLTVSIEERRDLNANVKDEFEEQKGKPINEKYLKTPEAARMAILRQKIVSIVEKLEMDDILGNRSSDGDSSDEEPRSKSPVSTRTKTSHSNRNRMGKEKKPKARAVGYRNYDLAMGKQDPKACSKLPTIVATGPEFTSLH